MSQGPSRSRAIAAAEPPPEGRSGPRGARNKKWRAAPASSQAEAPSPAHDAERTPRHEKILRAVIEELARSDYGGLTFERVAARAGVNKTTVYRRWETKAELVRDALSVFTRSFLPERWSGSLRENLIHVGHRMVDFALSFEGQCLVRLRLLDHPEPELAAIARDLQSKHVAQLVAMAEEARLRGQLAPGVDVRILLDMLGGALHVRCFMKNEKVDDVMIAQMVDILLHGAASGAPEGGAAGRARQVVARGGTRAGVRKRGRAGR